MVFTRFGGRTDSITDGQTRTENASTTEHLVRVLLSLRSHDIKRYER